MTMTIVISDTYALQHQEQAIQKQICRIFSARESILIRLSALQRPQKQVNETLTACSAKVGQTGPKHSLVIHSFSSTDRVSVPHLLRGVHIGAFLDQSLDNLRVPILGSPHQGRPALLRDDRTSINCSLGLSDKAGVVGVLRDRFLQVSTTEM
jgi:hypothetical protein